MSEQELEQDPGQDSGQDSGRGFAEDATGVADTPEEHGSPASASPGVQTGEEVQEAAEQGTGATENGR